MKSFSEMLQNLIKNNEEIKIYALAKDVNCERTRMQKIITGERECPEEFIKPLCEHILKYKNQAFVNQLYEAWAQEWFGYRKYDKLVRLRRRFEETKTNENFIKDVVLLETDALEKILKQTDANEDESIIIKSVVEMLEEQWDSNDKKRLYINIPASWSNVRNAILYLLNYQSKKRGYDNIENMIQAMDCKIFFANNVPEGENTKYTLVNNYISLCEFAMYGITAYTDFEKVNIVDNKEIMPYYMVSNHRAIFISADKKIMMNVNDDAFIKNISDRFIKSTEGLEFETYYLNSEVYMNDLFKNAGSASIYDIANGMCVGTFYTKSILEKSLCTDYPQRGMTIELVSGCYEKYRKNGTNMIFTMKALMDFLKEPEHINPLFNMSKEVKKETLCYMYNYYLNSDNDIAFIKDKQFEMHSDLDIGSDVNSVMNFVDFKVKECVLLNKMNFLVEANVARVFVDFFKYIRNSDCCLSKEQSLEILQNAINSL